MFLGVSIPRELFLRVFLEGVPCNPRETRGARMSAGRQGGGAGAATQESIVHVCAAGTATLARPEPGKPLGSVYTDALQCAYFAILAQHTSCGHTILLVADEEAQLTGAALNNRVSHALHQNVYGGALLVCLHEVGDDGDDERLADFHDFYRALGQHLQQSEQAVADYSKLSVQERALELLRLFA